MQSTECVFVVCNVPTTVHHYQKQFSMFFCFVNKIYLVYFVFPSKSSKFGELPASMCAWGMFSSCIPVEILYFCLSVFFRVGRWSCCVFVWCDCVLIQEKLLVWNSCEVQFLWSQGPIVCVFLCVCVWVIWSHCDWEVLRGGAPLRGTNLQAAASQTWTNWLSTITRQCRTAGVCVCSSRMMKRST